MTTRRVDPYLFFDGKCEEAVEFYKKTLGATDVRMMRFKESPDQSQCAPGAGDKIMHAEFKIGDSLIMGSDGRCEGKTNFQGFSLSITLPTEAEADRVFGALTAGGKVEMPLTKTFFALKFGMLEDQFGMGWMVIVPQPMPHK